VTRKQQFNQLAQAAAGGDRAVMETIDGWSVVAAGVVLRTFETNAAAWRWIDRQEGTPISRAEAVSDWIASKDDQR
jgi:hypothetical protein